MRPAFRVAAFRSAASKIALRQRSRKAIRIDDAGADAQRYIEDCEVCCRPIVFEVWRDAAGDWGVAASREDDA